MIFPQPRGCRSRVRLAHLRPVVSSPMALHRQPPRRMQVAQISPPPSATPRHLVRSLTQRVFHYPNPTAQPLSPAHYCHHGRKTGTVTSLPPTRRSTPPRPPTSPLLPQSSSCLLAPMTASQTRSHSGHSHGHHHHHDNTYLVSKNKNDPGVRITRIGLLSNLAMAIGKGFGGYVFNSSALIADAYHAATDLVSDFMTLATVSLSLKPPSSRFPFGYGKVESLGALGVSGLLLCGGFLMGLNAMEVLLTQFFPAVADCFAHLGLLGHGHSHGHSHDHELLGPNINAAWLAAGSILVKESLYHATMKVARQRKSSVLASNAIHHRVDSLTSFVALLTIGGAHILPDASWLDPVGGLIISLMVIRAGWVNTKISLLELADVSVDSEMSASVEKSVRKAISALPDGAGSEIQIREVQGIKSGQNNLMEVELAVPSSWSVGQTRVVEEAIRQRVASRVRGVKRLKVRFTPNTERDASFLEEFIARDVSPRSSPEPEVEEANGTAHHDKFAAVSSGSQAENEGTVNKRR
ncbi:cation efflux family protein [Blastomyces dermatitidis ATCC 18188]|uniref:Cation efflux family protein n=1 Tax=Ajellomyces dermatitidis (strain ATCC 18188 / CBS 674.68) TaxID=653446 RepID=F2TUL4_AJEDA|nr:cation efflux family protein [Blastomyces dermatitidis ATCC 18188]